MKRRPGDSDRWLADLVDGVTGAPGFKYDGKKRAKQFRETARQKDQKQDHRKRSQARRLFEIRGHN